MGKLSKLSKVKNITLERRTKVFLTVWLIIVIGLLIAAIAVPAAVKHETVQEAMRDAVLHDVNRISLFGLINVNPSFISALIVTAAILIFALIVRIFAVPRFKMVPGKFQMVIEMAVGLFRNMAIGNSPWRFSFLGVYIFAAGVYIFIGTLFELLGVQVTSVAGNIISLPAPLADVNSAIMMGVLSYFVIFFGAIFSNGFSGFVDAIKDISLIISMPFRLFGALLSGLLVTELVYYYAALSYGLPVLVGIMFTLLHALIQAYVLTLLTSLFFGEKTEKKEKKNGGRS